MAIDLRKDLLQELSTRIADLETRGRVADPDHRDAVRLGLYRGTQAMVKADRQIVPEIVRIAQDLYEANNGRSVSRMELGRQNRRFWLMEAAVTRFIVHGPSL